MNLKNNDKMSNEEMPIFSFINDIYSQINKKMDDYIVEGLKRKGFEFENRFEFENFIMLNCRCEDRTDIKQRIYFVKDIPFFLHCYEIEWNSNLFQNDNKFTMTVNYGRSAYL